MSRNEDVDHLHLVRTVRLIIPSGRTSDQTGRRDAARSLGQFTSDVYNTLVSNR
jgi:hypothetical protein